MPSAWSEATDKGYSSPSQITSRRPCDMARYATVCRLASLCHMVQNDETCSPTATVKPALQHHVILCRSGKAQHSLIITQACLYMPLLGLNADLMISFYACQALKLPAKSRDISCDLARSDHM